MLTLGVVEGAIRQSQRAEAVWKLDGLSPRGAILAVERCASERHTGDSDPARGVGDLANRTVVRGGGAPAAAWWQGVVAGSHS
jgi:hypothetical protein